MAGVLQIITSVNASAPSGPKTILCPVDFSSSSLAAFGLALELAESFDAKIDLVYGWQLPVLLESNPLAFSGREGQSLFDALEQSAHAKVDDFVARLSGRERARVRSHVAWAQGATTKTIIGFARQLGSDLIVMGTHGRGPVAHALIGSVTERVLRGAPCPVLTVRGPVRAKRKREVLRFRSQRT